MRETPMWGITPVPERLRVLGGVDTTLLWTNLGISLLVLVLPAYFDLSLKKALLATLVGGAIGNGMLALAALIGADARVPTMVLQRAPLGQRGSYAATVLNVIQCLGWAIFELIVIATAAGLLCDKLFGFRAIWFWKLLFGVVTTVLALLGPIGFVRRFVRKFAIWAVLASLVYLTWWILDGANVGHLWSHPGAHKGSFWLAVDTVVAVTVSWAPLVADYTRFSRDRRTAFFGVGIGYFLPTLYQFGFGSILVLSRGVDPNHPELILATIAGGGAAAALALPALTVDETDEAFANVSWVCGFVAYEWLYQPTGLGFWSRLVAHLPTPSYAIGASVPGFVVAFLLTAAFAALGSSRAAARARREPLVRSR